MRLPWVCTIVADLQVLRARMWPKLAELSALAEDLQPYWDLARRYREEWRSMAQEAETPCDDLDLDGMQDAKPPQKRPRVQDCGMHVDARSHKCAKSIQSTDVNNVPAEANDGTRNVEVLKV